MSILERLFSYLTPYECINCGIEGRMLCGLCVKRLKKIPFRCYICRKSSDSYTSCAKCRKKSPINSLFVAVVYEGLAKDLVWKLKYGSAKAVAHEMAQAIKPLLPCHENLIIIPVPTTTARLRQRGYDQAKLIAKELSDGNQLQYKDVIARHGNKHQVGATRKDRKTQLSGVFRVKSRKDIKNKHVLLVDDVLTTGATLEYAAKAIKKAGASRVSAVVFAQTE